jgi:hypothetical protein
MSTVKSRFFLLGTQIKQFFVNKFILTADKKESKARISVQNTGTEFLGFSYNLENFHLGLIVFNESQIGHLLKNLFFQN